MADSNKPIVPGGDTVGTVGEVYLSKNGKTYECVAVIDNTTVTPNGETIPRVEYVWVCTDDGAGGGTFPFDVSDAEPITISRTKEELIAAIDAGKTPIGYWLHTQSNGTVIRLFHFVKRFNATDGINLTFYFSDKTSSGVLDIRADGTIKRTYQHNDGGGASGSANFTFTITPTNGPGIQMLSVTRAEMLAALDSGKTLLGYWTETKTILETIDTIKHEFRLESVSGTGASRGLAFVNYEQFYKSTLYVNGNDTVSFVDKEVLPAPMTKTEAMTQSVGMDDDGRLWTTPGASGGGGGVQSDWNQNDETAADYVKNRPFYTGDPVETVLVEESTVTFEDHGGLYVADFLSTFEATVGEIYKVYWDGAAYECTGVDFYGSTVIGNLSIAGEGSDTGEPFLAVHNGKGIMIRTADTSATHTFSISGVVAPVVKIDPKYIRDMYYTSDPVETVLVEESTVSFTENNGLYMAQIQSNSEPTVGETYKVSWDGTVYECTCVKFDDSPAIGNLSIAGEGSDTGEPFLAVHNGKGIMIRTADTSATHTFSISGVVAPVVKIDEKYIPDTVATKSEVKVAHSIANAAQSTANAAKTTAENAQSTADTAQAAANSASHQLSKMATKTDPVFTGTFSQNRKIGSTSGAYSHAEGSLATASGNCSHAEGNTTVASGSGAHAEGSHTIASGEHSHAQGKFNVEDSQSKYAHIVGNGTNESARSNAHTLDWDGNAWFAGNVYVGGSDQSSGEKLATRNELPKRPVAQLVTLSASEWNADTKTQTITVFGVLADESAQLVTSTPLTTSARAYTNAGIALTGREENMVTFTAETIPTEDIKLYVVRQEIVLLDYLTFSSPEPFSIAVSKPGWDGTMEYFTDATSWTTWAGESISATEKNGKYSLYLRGTGNTVVTGLKGSAWSLTGSNISCTGNIETLLDYITVAAGGHPTMANSCYYNMFSCCTSLIQAPALPATTLTDGCYNIMFFSCTSLIQAPALPATTLANGCYNSMFFSCTSLIQAPALPATTLVEYCYSHMFQGCTSLTQAPELPATTLADGCYHNMFYDCTSLKLSSTQTGEYAQEYRIPSSGDGVAATDALTDMFTSTGGTFKGTPTINTTYYLSSDNMIVREA